MSEVFDWNPPAQYNFARDAIDRRAAETPDARALLWTVASGAIVASPDAMHGEAVKALVVLAAGHSPSHQLAAGVQDHVKRKPAPYKYPRRIEFIGSLPKTVSGKIRRKELRDEEFRDWEFRKADA